jgi:hypothetical protein
MTTRTLSKLFAFAPLFFVSAGFAQQQADRPLSYDYAYASLAVTELDSGGFEGGGSFTVAPNLHVFASYQDWEINSNVDRSILQVGAAYHWDISDSLDIVVGLALADSELDPPGPAKIDGSGPILSGSLRGWLTNAVELTGTISLDDSLDSSSNTVLEIGGQYHMSNQFSLGGRVRIDEDETTLFFGGRFSFGRGN